ncbi:MAG: M28 family peptidase [Nitrospinaceae bacterium]
MNSRRRKSGSKRPWVHRCRILTYTTLALFLTDYFLIHPAQVDPVDLPPPEPGIRKLAARLSRHVHFLASPELAGRQPGTPGNRSAENYLVGELEQYGLAALSPQAAGANGFRTQPIAPDIGSNVYSALTGASPDRRWILVGAHFDHLGEEDGKTFLGADDNASGVAILLETARILQSRARSRNFNFLFVAFNSEESPYFLTQRMGSHHFVHHLDDLGLRPEDIGLAIIMDLMGGVRWEPLRETVFVMGAEKSPELESLIGQVTVPGLTILPMSMRMAESVPTTGGMIFSDYQAFRQIGAPFLFLSSGRTPDYHRPTDTADRLHYARMARTTRWLVQLLETLDARTTPFRQDRRRENYVQDYRSLLPLIEAAATWTGKVPQTGWITLGKLKQDRGRLQRIGEKIRRGENLGPEEGRALSLASIRLQCLLGNMGPCFLLPGQEEGA